MLAGGTGCVCQRRCVHLLEILRLEHCGGVSHRKRRSLTATCTKHSKLSVVARQVLCSKLGPIIYIVMAVNR